MAPPVPMRARWRRLRFGLATVLGIAPRGFFIPCRHAGAVADPVGENAYPALAPLFEGARGRMEALLGAIDGYAAELRAIGGDPPPAPRWDQAWFPPLDAAAAYALVRTRKPSRIVEVGGGHSTRFLARAAADGGLATAIATIDPAPRALLPAGVAHIAAPLQAAPDAAAGLGPGDMLFIDSSHILMPGSDVDLALSRLWPRLSPGVLVHFHDIFLPDGYPASWRWRGYNEQSGVAALLAGGAAAVIFASHFAATRMADRLGRTVVASLPRHPAAIDASLWLEKKAGPG